jgi:hypothetical protein
MATSLSSIDTLGTDRRRSSDVMRQLRTEEGATWADAVAIVREVRLRQPALYETEQRKLRDLYMGHQQEHAQQAIAKRFPLTASKFIPMTLNITKTVADMGALAYRGEVTHRPVVDGFEVFLEESAKDAPEWKGGIARSVDSGEEILASPRAAYVAERIAHIKRASRYDLVMPAAERRANAGGTVFLRIAYRSGLSRRHRGRYAITLHWACDVWVLEDDDYPGEIHRALAYVVRLSSGEYEMCSRALDDDGRVRGWYIDRFDGPLASKDAAKEDLASPSGRHLGRTFYEGQLMPLVVMHSVYSDTVYAHDQSDVVDTQDAVNVALSSHWLKDDIQGYSQIYTTGPEQRKGETMVTGPLTIAGFPTGTTVGVLNTQHDLTTIQGIEKHLRLSELTLRLPHEALSTSAGASQSGFSRVLQSMPALERRGESVRILRAMEEEQLWPVLIEQHDLYDVDEDTLPIGADVDVRAHFPPPPDYESPADKLSRAMILLNAGLVTYRAAAVMSGAYPSAEAASDAGVPDEFAPRGGVEVPSGVDNRLRGPGDIGVRDGLVDVPTGAPEPDETNETAGTASPPPETDE